MEDLNFIEKTIRYMLLRLMPNSTPFSIQNIRDTEDFLKDETILMNKIMELIEEFIKKYATK